MLKPQRKRAVNCSRVRNLLTDLAAVRDENLKKLLMSWYYAGYYTGLHEGQSQALAPSQEQAQQ